MWSVYNSVAWYQVRCASNRVSIPFWKFLSSLSTPPFLKGSTQALPVTTIILLLLIWLCVGFPLTVLGGIIGKNRAGKCHNLFDPAQKKLAR
jgi:transmembrane 9 superfamily protein 1